MRFILSHSRYAPGTRGVAITIHRLGSMTTPRLTTTTVGIAAAAFCLAVGLSACGTQNTSQMNAATPLTSTSTTKTTTTHKAPPSTPESTPVGPCEAEQLEMVATPSGNGAGSTFTEITLTNKGPACILKGFPGLSLLDGAKNQIGAAATREGEGQSDNSGSDGLIQTGSNAHFGLRSSNPHIQNCDSVAESVFVQVYPPNDTGSITAPLTLETCTDESVETLSVTHMS